MSDQPPPGNYPPSGDYPPPGNYPPPPGNQPPGNQPPGNYPPGGYQQPGQYPPAAPKNTLGIVALVLAILAILTSWTIVGGVILGLAAIILGFLARSRVKKGLATNGTAAIVSIVLGIIGLLLSIALVVFGVGLFNSIGGKDYVDCISDAGNSESARAQCEDQFQNNIEDRYGVTVEPTR